MRRYIIKLHSPHLSIWGFVGAIILVNPAIALTQDKSNYIDLFLLNHYVLLEKQRS